MNGSALREISLGDDFGEVVVKANGARVQFHSDGTVETLVNPVLPTVGQSEPGDEMPDGTIYAGVSPDSGEAMYVTPGDAPQRMTFNDAAAYAASLDAHGHKDWCWPTKGELLEIYKNRNEGALKGTFNETTGSGDARWYWSCSELRKNPSGVYVVSLSDGAAVWNLKDHSSLSLRPLRTEPNP